MSRNQDEIAAKSPENLQLNGRAFSPDTRELRDANGTPIALRRQSADVLAALVAAEGRTVTKDDLIAQVWPETSVTDDSLVQCIADIRRALDDGDRAIVETVPRIGYRLNADNGPSGAPRRRWTVFAGAAAAILAAIAIGWQVFLKPADLPDLPRIAVLAFDDFSTGEDKGFLSDAIAEGLITELARFPSMAVIARTSSFSYRDAGADIDTIRDELRVHYVLEGSQQKSGNDLRVTAQLIDARSGEHIWTEVYDRELADLFTVQEEIVRGVAGIVGDIVELRPLPAGDLNQVSAFRFFQQSIGSPDSREQMEERFELGRKALAVDPDSEWGYLIMGWAHRHMAVFFTTPEEKPEHLARAAEYADRAIEIAPRNYIGHWMRARVQGENGDHAAANDTYARAIALNPSAVHMLVGSSSPLLYTGRFEEGLAVIDRALDLDPKHDRWFHWQRAWALWELDRCEEGLAAFRRMAKIPGGAQRMLAATHACLGNKPEAQAAMKVFLDDNPGATLRAEREKLAKTWPNPPSVEKWMEHMAFAGMPD